MQWIESVERRNGAWGVLVSEDHEETTRWHPTSELKNLMPAANGNYRRRLISDLATWSVSSAAQYLSLIGDCRTPMDEQMVFSFHHDGTEYLVPAVVIVNALFRPLRFISPYLFRPASLELISTPTGDASAFTAMLTLDSANRGYNEPLATQPLFTWAWAYPSARKMWSSLYQYALQGKLGATLPMATVSAVFHGFARGNQVAVTEMRVMQITTTEQSDLEVPPATNTFILHSGAINAPMLRCDAELRLIKGMEKAPRPLTDDEWSRVEVVLNRRSRPHLQTLNQRDLLNGIIAKLVTGTPWRSATYEVGDWRTASTNYRRWKVGGLWSEICSELLAA